MARSRSLPAAQVKRARIILMAAQGMYNTKIAEKVDLTASMIGYWRKRFLLQRLEGLRDEPRPGGPRSIADEEIAVLLRKTLETKPRNAAHWSCRLLAEQCGISKSTVQRVWRACGQTPRAANTNRQ